MVKVKIKLAGEDAKKALKQGLVKLAKPGKAREDSNAVR
jgi:hypothetical protein